MKRSSVQFKILLLASLLGLLALTGCYQSKKSGGGGNDPGLQKTGDLPTEKPFGLVLLDVVAPDTDAITNWSCTSVPASLGSLRAAELDARIKSVVAVLKSSADKVQVTKTMIPARDCGTFDSLNTRAGTPLFDFVPPDDLKYKPALHVLLVIWYGEPTVTAPSDAVVNQFWPDVNMLMSAGYTNIKTVYHFALTSPGFGYMQDWSSLIYSSDVFQADVTEDPPLDGTAIQVLGGQALSSAQKILGVAHSVRRHVVHGVAVRIRLALLLATALMACDKVPLRQNATSFDFTAAHYFENEKTEYLFFSVAGLRPGQAKVSWPSKWEMALDANGTGDVAPFTTIDFSQGVHQHHLVECGDGRLCGSYSFHAEQAPASVKLRFYYDSEASLALEQSVATQTHGAGAGLDAQSALIYGVFNHDNRQMQIRVHDNFGSPSSDAVSSFGLERTFSIDQVALTDFSGADELALVESSGSKYLYPAVTCASRLSRVSSATPIKIRGRQGWWPRDFAVDDPNGLHRDACLSVRTEDRWGQTVRTSFALGRRNPVLVDESLVLQSPVRTTRKIPLILSYCASSPGGANLVSDDFLSYQRFILGFPDTTAIDACFTVGQETQFVTKIKSVISRKIQEAAAASDGSDFILTVAINERLDPSIVFFHQTIADALADAVTAASMSVSPRLVGAFVYDSQAISQKAAPLTRQITPKAGLMWCPRKEDDDGVYGPNCAPMAGGQVALGPFNFVVPMGPFPTLDNYLKFTNQNGHDGRSGNPSLVIQAPITNENSQPVLDSQSDILATFIDGERFALAGGEAVKGCAERDTDGTIYDLALRVPPNAVLVGDVGGSSHPKYLAGDQLPTSISAPDGTPVAIDVGLRWRAPFIGAFSVDTPLTGQIFNFIPLSKTFRDEQVIGDPEWSRTNWNIGPLFQKCLRNCDHPYFDEAGTYQIASSWSATPGCPKTQAPEPSP